MKEALLADPPSRSLPQPASSTARTAEQPARLISLDAYRGFVMLLMISAGLNISRVALNFKESPVWQFLAYQTDHAAWRGCTLWDLIQPSFMFIVGVALPYSIAARRARGDSFGRLFGHALWRSFALVLLGVFLASTGHQQTNYTFTIVLAQIGLAYPFLWLLAWTRPSVQWAVLGFIVIGYWLLFAFSPLPAPGFDFDKVGVPQSWQFFQGFEAHWQKNANVAATFDQWFLNQFPQEKPFVFNAGGYLTLNFIPSLATMIVGLIAGQVLLRNIRAPRAKALWLVVAGLAALLIGGLWDLSGYGPMVKRIWTPSFAVFSAGWSLLLLSFFYFIIDVKGYRRWAFPFVVAGMNSIALYCMSMLMKPFFRERLKLHLGRDVFNLLGPTYAPMMEMAAILLVLWLISFWMYRKKIFLRI
jgi:predicted acyltransferase